jgi:hypothetical protein
MTACRSTVQCFGGALGGLSDRFYNCRRCAVQVRISGRCAVAAVDASAALALERIDPTGVQIGSRHDPASSGGGGLDVVSRRRLAHRHASRSTHEFYSFYTCFAILR